MASLFDEFDSSSCLACESPKIAYICTDCTGPQLQLCEDCYKGHVAAGHTVVDINEYQKNPSGYQLAEDRECRKHQGEQLTLACALCKVILCVVCQQDSSVTCKKAPGGKGRHETMPLKTALECDKKIIDESLGKATSNDVYVNDAIKRCNKMKCYAHTQHNRVKEQAENDEQKLISVVKAKTKSIIEKSARNVESFSTQVDGSINKMKHFRENLRRTRKEAEGLKSSSADVTVHRRTSSVVDRLTTPFTFPVPNIPILKLEKPPGLNGADVMENIPGGPLVNYVKGARLEDAVSLAPYGCCDVTTTKGTALVEVYGIPGIFFSVPGKPKQKMSDDGVAHWSICTSPDGKIIYSTTCITIFMYTVEDDTLNLIGREVYVRGARNLSCIRASPTTGHLAILDGMNRRITLHDKEATFLRSIEEGRLDWGGPSGLEWSSSGDYFFIADWGENDGPQSVIKLKVEPTEIVWRKFIGYDPSCVRHVGGRLYIAHAEGAEQVTVMSAEDGSSIKTITVPGEVVEIRDSLYADVKMVYY